MGYRYVGCSSIYQLLWPEIFRVVDASKIKVRITEDAHDGIRPGDLKKFEKYTRELEQKSRANAGN